jgi:hypothetical protein
VPPEAYQGNQQARSMALRDAMETARQNLFQTLLEIWLDSDSKLSDMLHSDGAIAQKLKTMIKEAPLINQQYLTDGTVGVTLQMSLWGGFAQLVLPTDVKQIESIIPIEPNGASGKPSAGSSSGEAPTPQHFTGLVVDARGMFVHPALAPRVLDENGEEIYGPAFVSREFAVQLGMAGYTTDLSAALSDPRVMDHPLLIKAVKSQGPGRCDLVVSVSDANRLRCNFNHLSFLKRGRVIIVVDPPAGVPGTVDH